jgi:hypothetical protein
MSGESLEGAQSPGAVEPDEDILGVDRLGVSQAWTKSLAIPVAAAGDRSPPEFAKN